MTRLDIIVKALVADAWSRGDDHLARERSRMYSRYIDARLRDAANPSSVRLAMFRGLYDSVRTLGRFDWEGRPIVVDRHFNLIDGAHRVALALVLRQHRVGLRRECATPQWLRNPPAPQNLAFVGQAVGAANRELVRARASELFASGKW